MIEPVTNLFKSRLPRGHKLIAVYYIYYFFLVFLTYFYCLKHIYTLQKQQDKSNIKVFEKGETNPSFWGNVFSGLLLGKRIDAKHPATTERIDIFLGMNYKQYNLLNFVTLDKEKQFQSIKIDMANQWQSYFAWGLSATYMHTGNIIYAGFGTSYLLPINHKIYYSLGLHHIVFKPSLLISSETPLRKHLLKNITLGTNWLFLQNNFLSIYYENTFQAQDGLFTFSLSHIVGLSLFKFLLIELGFKHLDHNPTLFPRLILQYTKPPYTFYGAVAYKYYTTTYDSEVTVYSYINYNFYINQKKSDTTSDDLTYIYSPHKQFSPNTDGFQDHLM